MNAHTERLPNGRQIVSGTDPDGKHFNYFVASRSPPSKRFSPPSAYETIRNAHPNEEVAIRGFD
jgi:hypothetical protein